MLSRIIQYSIHHKLIVFLFVAFIVGFGVYSLLNIPIGAVPDITNNQVQVITTSRNLATEEVEKYITYPVELEMANLPGVKEIRSVSKFGLSVVTIVFEDEMGTYLPRQLISEKISTAVDKIPEGFGKPFLGPVTTGLGEIYQYTVEVDEEHKGDYTITELRTIQDWMIRRQLSGIPGVVEVNTWGGYLKQYTVSADPFKLKAMDISISEVYTALESNNGIAGGSYIEKTNEAYFIRGQGQMTEIGDIERTVVTRRNGVPVLIRDLARVEIGHATRFGAVTGNGEGEKVMGQVMMLRDANSNKVINAVKERVASIQPSLPEGVSINGFLERSALIGKTTNTVIENLVLGCLIVIFVVVLLLGNIRSGLVIASVIPLSLLFALSLMYIFDVDANLMSLGAIDFGIIIDGAVIIVEYIAYRINKDKVHLLSLDKKEYQKSVENITFRGASKMMHSAVFGQLIIIIVFIPILSLVNVEGKMFRPMALVFCFALIGAMVLCFTYLPVMASLFVKPEQKEKNTWSKKLISKLEGWYQPTIQWALRNNRLVITSSVALLILSGIIYSSMGGEFVPTLDEGDFVIQPVLKTGTSLGKTIEICTEIEKKLMEFPEVDQVVTRIGAAEVPTDPMSMEEADVIIILKDHKHWVSADTKDELANLFKESLSDLPVLDFEFTQPIEMRFNELITGVRADLAIKIFGEDLNVLSNTAHEISKAIEDIPGASDVVVEKVEGLPQMTVHFNRKSVARHGLKISELNELVSTGFAGAVAGDIFEGEKRFDLVLKFDKEHRNKIDDLRNASIPVGDGKSIPLSELAEIEISKGPAKISRDDTKRRIVVGVNVRDRDLESVVEDVQKKIEKEIDIPTGYVVEYGGQFENLRSASRRLQIAVPIALILIFILLYFAFDSTKEALLIFSAIPLASIGGVLLLYFRDMPFSISAGVGFIALFGISVLNGIVLIEEFKDLKSKGYTNICRRIMTGTRNRLRPVLLTASAAALGFLPMAVSTSAGAEVQRPLATVVIGGLVSATALTLIVLPLLYSIFDRRSFKPRRRTKRLAMGIITILLMQSTSVIGQEKVTAQKAVELALRSNMHVLKSTEEVERFSELKGSAYNIEKTNIYYQFDENNIALNGEPISVIGISQKFDFPGVYSAQRKTGKSRVELVNSELEIIKARIEKEVLKAYYKVVYLKEVKDRYVILDSLYRKFSQAIQLRFEKGDANLLEKLSAEAKHAEVNLQFSQQQDNLDEARLVLNRWMQTQEKYDVADDSLIILPVKQLDSASNPVLKYYNKQIDWGENQIRIERNKMMPSLTIEAFQGTNNAPDSRVYNGFMIGIGIPLFFGSQSSKISAAKRQNTIRTYEYQEFKFRLINTYEGLLLKNKKNKKALEYHSTKGKSLIRELVQNASFSMDEGEIDYFRYVQLIDQAQRLELTYLQSLHEYNMSVIDLNYILD